MLIIPERTRAESAERIEAWGSLIVLAFMFAAIGVVGIMVMLDFPMRYKFPSSNVPRAYLTTVWAILLVLEWRSLMYYADQFKYAISPFGLSMALNQTTFRIWQKPFIACWWLMNAVAATEFGGFFSRALMSNHSRNNGAVGQFFAVGIFVGSTFACNVLVLMAVATICGNRRFLAALWRLRYVADVLVAFGITYVWH